MSHWVNYDPSVRWHGKYNPTRDAEQNEQIKVLNWASSTGRVHRALDTLFHIPNGGGRSKAEAGILKAMGVKAGVLDLFLPLPVEGGLKAMDTFCGMWVEMKCIRARNHPDKPGQLQVQATSLSPEQKEFAALMIERGYAVTVAWWETAAQDALRSYVCGTWVQRPLDELLKGYEL